jgi:superfamily II DNA/RNA helicase
LGVPAPIAGALAAAGLTAPFPIQSATLPDALAGRDVLGRARTGSGKTIAFVVPLVGALTGRGYRRTPSRPGALVLVPTRELVAQVARTVTPLAAAVRLQCATIHGGVAQRPQTSALHRGADIVIATPGRLEDLIAQGHCDLTAVQITVLDEADHLADLGFLPAVRRLLDRTPTSGQRLLFSATLDDAVTELVRRYLGQPATHAVDPPDASPDQLDHHVFVVEPAHKATVVAELAAGSNRSLLFTRTKHGARKLARQLTTRGISAAELHANLSQTARDRNLAAFADGSARTLVATDIAARGIHVEGIGLVVHVDPPAEHKAYLHRSGRTARAGAAGSVVTIATPDQLRDLTSLLRKASVVADRSHIAPGDAAVAALSGPPATQRTPALPTKITARPHTAASHTPLTSAPAPRDQRAGRFDRGDRPSGRPAQQQAALTDRLDRRGSTMTVDGTSPRKTRRRAGIASPHGRHPDHPQHERAPR